MLSTASFSELTKAVSIKKDYSEVLNLEPSVVKGEHCSHGNGQKQKEQQSEITPLTLYLLYVLETPDVWVYADEPMRLLVVSSTVKYRHRDTAQTTLEKQEQIVLVLKCVSALPVACCHSLLFV